MTNFVKKYINYLKDNPNHYWFKRKWYGWGWVPATREGWLVTLIFVAFILTLALRLDKNATDIEAIQQLLLPLFASIVVFLFIAYKKGEKPKWSWGEKRTPGASQEVVDDSSKENHPTN